MALTRNLLARRRWTATRGENLRYRVSIVARPPRGLFERCAYSLDLRIVATNGDLFGAGNARFPLGGGTMHARSISSSRHIYCVRLLRKTARNSGIRQGWLAHKRPIGLQRILRGWPSVAEYRR
jgi:hypothetical protein